MAQLTVHSSARRAIGYCSHVRRRVPSGKALPVWTFEEQPTEAERRAAEEVLSRRHPGRPVNFSWTGVLIMFAFRYLFKTFSQCNDVLTNRCLHQEIITVIKIPRGLLARQRHSFKHLFMAYKKGRLLASFFFLMSQDTRAGTCFWMAFSACEEPLPRSDGCARA